MGKDDIKYLNFPVQLLKGMLTYRRDVLNDILDYSVYAHSLNLNYNTRDERFTEALHYYAVIPGSKEKSYRNGRDLYDSIPINSPMTGITVKSFWEYFQNDKTDFEMICLLAFLALKSIIGHKARVKTNNLFWLSRMDGHVRSVSLEELSPEIREYYTPYRMRKIKIELVNSWGLKTYSKNTRGFYVTFRSDITIDDLAYTAVMSTYRAKNEIQKITNREAFEKAKKRVFGMTSK
jgi:hypothetical protein